MVICRLKCKGKGHAPDAGSLSMPTPSIRLLLPITGSTSMAAIDQRIQLTQNFPIEIVMVLSVLHTSTKNQGPISVSHMGLCASEARVVAAVVYWSEAPNIDTSKLATFASEDTHLPRIFGYAAGCC
jgi:hypothetical protein